MGTVRIGKWSAAMPSGRRRVAPLAIVLAAGGCRGRPETGRMTRDQAMERLGRLGAKIIEQGDGAARDVVAVDFGGVPVGRVGTFAQGQRTPFAIPYRAMSCDSWPAVH